MATKPVTEIVIRECVGVIHGVAFAYSQFSEDQTFTGKEIAEALIKGAEKLPEAFGERAAELEAEGSEGDIENWGLVPEPERA